MTTRLVFDGRPVTPVHVTASLIDHDNDPVLKVQRDLESLPFDEADLVGTVDEPTFVTVDGLDIASGSFEVQVKSRIDPTSPYTSPQGFIGVAFRVQPDNTAFESIYLRPNAGRSPDQFVRNHAVQYFAYPNFKFDRLRAEQPGRYETYADIGLDEWTTLRVDFHDRQAQLYLNDGRHPAFVVNDLRGITASGSIGLWVDIGTEGYFRHLRIHRQTAGHQQGNTVV